MIPDHRRHSAVHATERNKMITLTIADETDEMQKGPAAYSL